MTVEKMVELARRRIVRWMESNPHITQAEIGRAVGHNQGWVSKFKLGELNADLDELNAIARVYGHTLNELLDLRPDPRERALIEAYRALPPEKRELSVKILESMIPPPRERHK